MKLVETYGDSYVAQHAWYNIGRCHEQTGEWAGAADAYETQLSLYPVSAWADKSEARLSEIRFKVFSRSARDDAGEAPSSVEPAARADTD